MDWIEITQKEMLAKADALARAVTDDNGTTNLTALSRMGGDELADWLIAFIAAPSGPSTNKLRAIKTAAILEIEGREQSNAAPSPDIYLISPQLAPDKQLTAGPVSSHAAPQKGNTL